MQALLSFVLASLLLLLSAGAQADVYQNVNQLIGAGQWSQAHTQAQEHLKTRPTDPQMRLLLSRIQDGQGQTAEAMSTLQALTQSFPELPEPHNNLAALLARQNRYAEALVQLQEAVRARPDYGTALENLGDVYIALAIEAYDKAHRAAAPQPRVMRKRQAAEQLLLSSVP
ncbi:tetratricopeptide repeat protein [Limnohabitans sp. DCL3]|uniref:tetratricopeptide repeat protein n=1 Tax=Limnohabitans sp. DCL3 TaxID=3374103 RepID=UPI003A884896